jgi:hypothetical protein
MRRWRFAPPAPSVLTPNQATSGSVPEALRSSTASFALGVASTKVTVMLVWGQR